MKVYEKLNAIQVELKAPKSQFNSFGKYKYRNLEDIQEALKPLLAKYKAAVTISDEIALVGDRFYIKATASLIDIESGDKVEATGWAREGDNKKGMDVSQLTGATSSYARKYAMNGLFAIDDTKDADNFDNRQQQRQPVQQQRQPVQQSSLAKCSGCGVPVPSNVERFSTDKYGKALCFSCQKKEG